MLQDISFKNPVRAEVVREDGTVEELELTYNDVTNEGYTYLLGTGFRNQAVNANWYVGLIKAEVSGAPVLAATDTMASRAWTEATEYSEATRVGWSPSAVGVKQVSNSAALVYTFNASVGIRGIFVASANTKGGSTGTLWATALFNANMVFTSSEIIRLIYTVSAT